MNIFSIPNIITLSRIVLMIPALYFFENKEFLISLILIIILLITDFLDGYIARKFNMQSFIGAILDPIADKLVVMAFFTYLLIKDNVNLIYYLLIMIRDISQLSSIPILLLYKKIMFKVKPKLIPKWGTALNFILLIILMIQLAFDQLMNYNELKFLKIVLYLISGFIEIYILITFIPRFILIYNGKHDTFE
jgi:cardiolipin synthase (CMP-forming)